MKRILFACFLLYFYTCVGWFDSPPQVDFAVIQRRELSALRTRMMIGFIGGFCSHALLDYSVKANTLGMPATVVVFQRVNRSVRSSCLQEARWFDVANAYVVGAFAGVLVRRACIETAARLKAIFCNPAACVPITNTELDEHNKN